MRARPAVLSALLLLRIAAMAEPTRAAEPAAPPAVAEATAPAAAATLPPLDCVRRVRSARIADGLGNHDIALQQLKVALRTCGDDLSPVTALLEHNARVPLPASEVRTYRDLLRTRLMESTRPLPPGLLRFMVDSPDLPREELELMLEAAKTRAGPAAGRALLETIVHLEERLERPADARRTLAGMLERWDEPFLRWRCIMLDFELERWADALPLLRRELAEEESMAGVLPIYVRALIASGDWQEAVKQLAVLETRSGSDLAVRALIVPMLIEAAWAARDAGQAQAAEAAFRRALEIDPRSTLARGAILYLYARPGEKQALLEAARRSIDADASPDELLNEGVRSLAAGDAEGALVLFMGVVEIHPDYEAGWFNAGLTALRLERWEEAENALSRAAALRPDRTMTRTLRGAALRGLGRCDEAIDLLLGVVAEDGGAGDAWRILAVCYQDLGRQDEALEAQKRAAGATPP